MSVNISVSSKTSNCHDILEKLLKYKINCRAINTISIVDSNIEQGCLLTFEDIHNSKKNVIKLWEIINSNNDYTCSHLKINGIHDGCLLDYVGK